MDEQPAPRTLSRLENALAGTGTLAQRRQGRHVAVFLDYDGTLTPIVDRPDMAVLSESMRRVLTGLAARTTVAIISGRDRADVERLVGLDGLVYAGSHGFDIAGPGGREIHHEMGGDFGPLLARVRERLEHELDGVGGVLLEPKKASLAVHYRLVDEADVPAVKGAVDAVLRAEPTLRMTPGKMVMEIQPRVDWNKGRAVLWLLEALGLDRDDVLPVYLGDDVTDEDAFRALAGRGVGIYVGDPEEPDADGRRTWAEGYLRDPGEVERFLAALET